MRSSLADRAQAPPTGPPEVHPSAIVYEGARIGHGVVIGPYCVIGKDVSIGDGTVISPHAVIEGWTTIGKLNQIGIGVVIGTPPQDKGYTGARSFVTVGDRNVIREYVTIHRAADEDGTTSVGNGNFLMANVHVAHNCRVGDEIVMANFAGLSGHITIEDHVVLGGLTAFHQHVRIGAYAIVGGGLRVGMDVVPFGLAGGDPLRIYGLNGPGLRRNGFSVERRRRLKSAYRILFWSGLTMTDALARLKVEAEKDDDAARIVKFAEGSKRGLTPGLTVHTGEHAEERSGE